MSLHHLEEIFRRGAGLDIQKGHANDIIDIVEQKLYDLLEMGQISAKYNGRDVIWKYDLPITKGLQESINEFKKLEEEIGAKDVVEALAKFPPLLTLEAELENSLPEIVGGITLVMARLMREINEDNRAVSHELIERAKGILDLTL